MEQRLKMRVPGAGEARQVKLIMRSKHKSINNYEDEDSMILLKKVSSQIIMLIFDVYL